VPSLPKPGNGDRPPFPGDHPDGYISRRHWPAIFQSSHLTERLLDDGHAVHVLDDLSTGSIENIAQLKRIRASATRSTPPQTSRWWPSLSTRRTSSTTCAAVGVELIVESPVRTLETNVHLTEIVLSQASKKKRPVLFTSTARSTARAPTSRSARTAT